MAKCGTCGGEILWGVTEAGKRVPLNLAEKRFVRADMMGDLASEDDFVMVDTHVSHFATCPQADQHRRTEQQKPRRTPPQDGQQQSLKENLRGQEQDDG